VALCGGFVYRGSVSGQAAQIIVAASLIASRNISDYDAPVGSAFDQTAATGFFSYAWAQGSDIITAGPTPQFFQIVSWTRTS
jgi:hypothetical protein